jgi:tRNA threonylcarbamoyl adenosine modification protein YjeE
MLHSPYNKHILKNMGLQVSLGNIKEIAKKIREKVSPGKILSISGPLGIGKTTFIKEMLFEYKVQSPSFLHALFYGNDFAHIDAYTFKSKEALFSMGIEEILEERALIIEWGNLYEKELEVFDAEIIKLEFYFEGEKRFLNY